jgi:hypothetical protein
LPLGHKYLQRADKHNLWDREPPYIADAGLRAAAPISTGGRRAASKRQEDHRSYIRMLAYLGRQLTNTLSVQEVGSPGAGV